MERVTGARRAALIGMKIGQLSRRLGLTARTLRYWEARGLLLPARRSEGGTRLYGDEHVRCAQGIQGLKLAGLRLGEVETLRKALQPGSRSSDVILEIREALAARTAELQASLEAQRSLLETLEVAREWASDCADCTIGQPCQRCGTAGGEPKLPQILAALVANGEEAARS